MLDKGARMGEGTGAFAMFGFTKKIEQLASGIARVEAAVERLIDVMSAAKPDARASNRDESMSKALESVLTAQSKVASSQTELMSRLVEQVSRRTMNQFFSDMGRKGVKARKEKKAEEVQLQAQGGVTVEEVMRDCEECRATLMSAAPRHAQDMLRHAQEKHATLIIPLFTSARTNGVSDSDN